MDRTAVIYKYDFPNGKCYVGQSWSMAFRHTHHLKYGDLVVDKALRKHKIDTYTIIVDGIKDQNALNCLETFYMGYYKTHITENGYNVDRFSRGVGKHSEKTIAKFRKQRRGKGNAMYGKTHSEESKSAMRDKAKKRVGPRNSMFGKNHTDDAKKRMSEKHTGRVIPPNVRENMSKAVERRWKDPAYRENMINKQSKKWEDPEFRKMMLEALAQGRENKKIKQAAQQNKVV